MNSHLQYAPKVMTTRTQYLIFLIIWVASCLAGVVIVGALGLSFGDNSASMRATFFMISVAALLPAAGGYALIKRCGSLVDRWRVRRGQDIYTERAYEDEDGYIHLNAVPDSRREHDIGVSEMLGDVRPAIDEALDNSGDSK